MKRFLVHISLFAVFATCFYILALMLWGGLAPNDWKKNLNYRRGASGFTYTRLREADTAAKKDIVFAGSSHAYRGFDTRIFEKHGYNSFNLGSSSQTPVQTKVLLEKYVDQFSPSVVVYEVYPYTFSSDGVESALDVIANSESIDAGLLPMAATVSNIKVYNTLVYGFIKRIIHPEKNLNEVLVIREKSNATSAVTSYIHGGFMEKKIESSNGGTITLPAPNESIMKSEADIVQTKEGKWNPRMYQLQAFESTLKMLKQKGIRVILVQAPVYTKYYSMIKCADEIDNYFRSKGEYYNFNKMMTFDYPADFADYHHLNQAGVIKMNEALLRNAFNKN